MGKSQNVLVGGFQLSSQLCISVASQSCFVFDVVNFENSGIVAELCFRIQKLRKPLRKASFFGFQLPNFTEVLRDSFVYGLADKKRDIQIDTKT